MVKVTIEQDVDRISELLAMAGWTYRDVAEVWGCSLDYVKSMAVGRCPAFMDDLSVLYAEITASGVDISIGDFIDLWPSVKEGRPMNRRKRGS